MGKTLRQLGAEMGADELDTWAAFEGEYGLPDGYFVAGLVCTVICRALGASKTAGPADFVPYFAPRRGRGAAMSTDAMLSIFKGVTKS